MSRAPTEDLESVARDVERAARALQRARRALAGPVEDPLCPLDSLRHVAGKSAYDGLLAASPSRASEPLRASLARWVAHLTAARVGWELEVDEAKARKELADPSAPSRGSLRKDAGPAGAAAALIGLLGADATGEAESFADRAARYAPRVLAARDERRAKLEEVARRLGATGRYARAIVHRDVAGPVGPPSSTPSGAAPSSLVLDLSSDLIAVLAGELSPAPRDAPDAALPGLDEEALRASATRFLRASEPLTSSLVRRAHRVRTGREGIAAIDGLRVSLGRETRSADWPARLSVEWMVERFAALSGKATATFRAPLPLGTSSFLRAAEAAGEALHRQESLRYAPFALAHDPHFVDAHRTGGLFASCLASPAFLARELGTGRGVATDTSRALMASLLFAARSRATALLLALDGSRSEAARASDGAVGGTFARLGFLSPRLDDDEPARWVAALTTPGLHARHVATFDEDYYRNPRAARAFRARFALPALSTTFVSSDVLDAAGLVGLADTLAATFERELG